MTGMVALSESLRVACFLSPLNYTQTPTVFFTRRNIMEKIYLQSEINRIALKLKLLRMFATFSAGFFIGAIIVGVVL